MFNTCLFLLYVYSLLLADDKDLSDASGEKGNGWKATSVQKMPSKFVVNSQY